MRFVVRTVDGNAQRAENIKKMKKNIPNLEVVVDKEHDAYRSFFTACRLIATTGGVLLEDDIALCDDFLNTVERHIKEHGNGKDVVNFFEKPKTYFKTGYVGGSNFLWMQCVYIPSWIALKFEQYYDEFKRTRPKKWQGGATDCLIAYTLTKEKQKYWRIRPCIVQHLDFKSLLGNRPSNRQTPYFIDDLKKLGIVYDDMEGLKNGRN